MCFGSRDRTGIRKKDKGGAEFGLGFCFGAGLWPGDNDKTDAGK